MREDGRSVVGFDASTDGEDEMRRRRHREEREVVEERWWVSMFLLTEDR